MHSACDLVMCLGDINGHVGGHIDGIEGVHGWYGVGQRNLEGRMLLEFSLEKESCVSNTWSKREDRRKVTFRMGENETKNNIVLIKKEQCEGNPWEFHHALVIADVDKRKIKKGKDAEI